MIYSSTLTKLNPNKNIRNAAMLFLYIIKNIIPKIWSFLTQGKLQYLIITIYILIIIITHLSGIKFALTSQFRASAVLLLLPVRNYKLWLRRPAMTKYLYQVSVKISRSWSGHTTTRSYNFTSSSWFLRGHSDVQATLQWSLQVSSLPSSVS